MNRLASIIFVLFVLTGVVTPSKFDYYWRDYFGDIPEDAVPGGLDRNHKPTYIAQVFILNQGVLPTRLYRGDKSVTTSKGGIHTSDLFIKVLCSNRPEALLWVPVTYQNLHTTTISKHLHLVVGGTENGKILNVGRVPYQGELIIGKVCGYNIDNALLFFPYHNQEKNVKAYEVLVYDHDASTIDPRDKNKVQVKG